MGAHDLLRVPEPVGNVAGEDRETAPLRRVIADQRLEVMLKLWKRFRSAIVRLEKTAIVREQISSHPRLHVDHELPNLFGGRDDLFTVVQPLGLPEQSLDDSQEYGTDNDRGDRRKKDRPPQRPLDKGRLRGRHNARVYLIGGRRRL